MQIPAAAQRWIAILLPPFSLLVCCTVMVPRQKKVKQAEKEIRVTQAGIQDYLNKLQAISDLPKDPRIATLPMTKQEQSDFLRGLSTLCNRTGNRLLNVAALAAMIPPAPPPGAPPPPAPPPGSLPPDVIEVKSTIVFEGSFGSLRAFLAGLQRSTRLISLTDCRIGPGQGGFPALQTTLSISRYVDLPPAN